MKVASAVERPRTGDATWVDIVFEDGGHTVKKTIRFNEAHGEEWAKQGFKLVATEAWRDLQWMKSSGVRPG